LENSAASNRAYGPSQQNFASTYAKDNQVCKELVAEPAAAGSSFNRNGQLAVEGKKKELAAASRLIQSAAFGAKRVDL